MTNLRIQLTSFIGRGAELELAEELLSGHRLVTLTGPGGAGKTRLAAQAAAGREERCPDGIWWVDLTTVAAADNAADADGAGPTGATGPAGADTAVAEAVAEAVGVPDLGVPLRALTAHLATRRVLLCLDNAEHVLDAVAGLAEAVLRGCPAAAILVTSREPLGVPGEAVLAVPPLSDDDALALFVDRARLARPGFALDAGNEAAIRSIAAHLDGIPLALELAAAWVRTLTPRQIEAGLDDRFALLVRGPRGAQRRQRTLAGSIDWSHALLDDVERAVFRRLAVFEGGFGLPAVRALCGGGSVPAVPAVPAEEVLPALGRLVDKSLVVAEDHAEEVRYRLLETIGAYATARLVAASEDRLLRDRHLAWCVRFVATAEADREQDSDLWRRVLLQEYDNLRAALDWGLAADDPTEGRELAASLAWFWHFSHRGREGLGYLRRAIDRAPTDRSPLQARLLTGVALVADTASPLDVEHDAADRALALATEVGDEGLRALCLNLSAVGAFYTDFEAAWQLSEQAHAAARAASHAGGSDFALGASRALQAVILHLRDRHAEAEALVDWDVRHLLRHHRGILSTVLAYQADGAFALGDTARALDLAEQAVLAALPLGDHLRVGMAQAVLARLRALTGDVVGAAEAIDPVRRLVADVDVFIPFLDQAMAVLETRRGDLIAAIPWLRRAAASTDRGTPTWIAGTALLALGAALVGSGLHDEAAVVLDTALAVTRRLGLPGPLARTYAAQAELAAAAAATESDGSVRAAELRHAALTVHVEHQLIAFQPDDLEALVRYGAATRPTIDDVRVLHASQAARVAMGLPRTAKADEAFKATAELLRKSVGDAAFEEAARAGVLLPLDQAVARVRRSRGSRGRPATGWLSLTPTEREVVGLVVEGLTNPQIAERLFMSRGTVKTHLSHIFAKLGTANRTELAAAAAANASAATTAAQRGAAR